MVKLPVLHELGRDRPADEGLYEEVAERRGDHDGRDQSDQKMPQFATTHEPSQSLPRLADSRRHDLVCLYSQLPAPVRDCVEAEYQSLNPNQGALRELLVAHKDDFVEWRYLSLLKRVWVGAAPVRCLHSRGTASR